MSNAASIPQTDPRAAYLAQEEAIDTAVKRVLTGGWYVGGAEVEAFEKAFAAAVGVAHGIGCASGTDAIELALRSCGIGAGDLVFTVSHTAVATVAAVERAGASAVLMDIEPGGYTMDPEALAAALRTAPRGRPAAVLPVHLYGEPAAMPAIVELARAHGLRVIEDCAQSHGATLDGRATGAWGDIACFSFYPTKNLGALGDGGIVVTGDEGIAAAAREIREYGWRERYVSACVGINSRLDPIQAAMLGVKLPRLAADNARRRAIAARYEAGLAGLPLTLPPCRAGAVHVYHQYVVRSPERDRLRDHLRGQGVGTGIHYPVPVHLQEAYRDRIAAGPLGETEKAAGEILSLPMYPHMTDEAVERAVAAIVGFFR